MIEIDALGFQKLRGDNSFGGRRGKENASIFTPVLIVGFLIIMVSFAVRAILWCVSNIPIVREGNLRPGSGSAIFVSPSRCQNPARGAIGQPESLDADGRKKSVTFRASFIGRDLLR